jgi:hypothetical protein
MYKLLPLDKLLNVPAKAVLRVEDKAFIPFDPDNTDYQAYLKWLADGNTPLPAENA